MNTATKMWQIRRLSLLMGLFAFLLSSCRHSLKDDLTILEERLIESILPSSLSPERIQFLDNAVKTMNADGSWPDIDYEDERRISWSPDLHLSRMETMALAYTLNGSEYHHSEELQDQFIQALDFWCESSPTSDNHYIRRIGAPNTLAEMLLLMHEEVPEDLLNRTINYMDKGILPGGYSRLLSLEKRTERTTDVVRLANVHIAIGVMKDEPSMIDDARKLIAEECVVKREGNFTNPDWSFQYHGAQLNKGYGIGFYTRVAEWGVHFEGLQWAFEDDVIDYLRGGLLKGFQWLVRRNSWTPFSLGRGIARNDQVLAEGQLVNCLNMMKRLDPEFSDSYQDFIDHISGRNDGALTGNRYFYCTDFGVHRRADYMFSLHMSSVHTVVQETGNDENISNAFLSQGATAILRHGREYLNIFPLWEWNKIPGVTAPADITREEMSTRAFRTQGKSPVAGGASDNINSVSGMILDWYGVKGRKAWFFFDDMMFALGSDLIHHDEFHTAINSCRRIGDVYYEHEGTNKKLNASDTYQSATTEWIWHDSIAYFFPGKEELVIKNQTGAVSDWKIINPGAYPEGLTVKDDIFTANIPHKEGKNKYSYGVAPAIAVGEIAEKMNQVNIISNNSAIQAVYHTPTSYIGIVFWNVEESNMVSVNDISIEVDMNVFLLVKMNGNNNYTLSASHPNKGGELNVMIKSYGELKSAKLILPDGIDRGKSVTVSI